MPVIVGEEQKQEQKIQPLNVNLKELFIFKGF